MIIEVATKEGSPETERGNLLEILSAELLLSLNYEVIRQIRITGMELDLLCKSKTNGKEIYVECKAYNIDNPIQSKIITSLMGTRDVNDYKEAWLITTTELTKDSKGLVKKITDNQEKSYLYSFYTPDKLIEALVNSSKIKSETIINEVFIKSVEDINKLGDTIFLINKYGRFWVRKYLDGGIPVGVIIAFANNGNIIKDKKLLENLSELKTSFKELDFNIINTLTEENGEITPQNISIENLKLNINHLNKINDIGFKITHPNREYLYLDDVFIYPDLEKSDEESEYISSKELINNKSKYNKCLIFGDDVSGKTSMAYILQKHLNIDNFVAIYINANEINKSNELKFQNLLIKKFEEQYSNNKYYVEAFKNILNNDSEKIILIIDDYDLIGIKKSDSQIDFLRTVNDKFKNIFIFANRRIEIEVMAKSEIIDILNDFEILKIKELGYSLRDDLIEKWINLDNVEEFYDSEIIEKKDRISGTINVSVGTNFIPTYPIYILTMLQFIDDASKLKLQGSSYAELYGFLITKALCTVNTKAEDLDFLHTYLSHLAFYLFKNRKKVLTHKEISEFYKDYSEKMDIGKKFDNVHNILIKSKIIKNDNDFYQFNHSYSYYFFTAKYLSDNIKREEILNEINTIINKLYTNEFANIIIFLIHHSKDQCIIDSILEQGEKIFEGVTPYLISLDQTTQINNLLQEEIKLSLKDGKPSDYRKKELEEKDKIESKNKKKEDKKEDSEEEIDLFSKLNLSFKLIEIQGQIMKNYFGSLDGNKKIEILDSTNNLGFRGLSVILKDFENFQASLDKNIKEKIKEKKAYSEIDVTKIINKILFTFNGGIVTFFIKKISDSIASKDLLITIEKNEKNNANPATQLISMAVKLNFPDGFDKKIILDLNKSFDNNYLAKTILKILVIEHMYKFDVKYSDKQSLCSGLGIDFVQAKKMLDKGRKK